MDEIVEGSPALGRLSILGGERLLAVVGGDAVEGLDLQRALDHQGLHGRALTLRLRGLDLGGLRIDGDATAAWGLEP